MVGFPIRRFLDQSLLDSSPGLIAAYRVLHRLITPRHPPCTLSSLITSVVGPLYPKGPMDQRASALALDTSPDRPTTAWDSPKRVR